MKPLEDLGERRARSALRRWRQRGSPRPRGGAQTRKQHLLGQDRQRLSLNNPGLKPGAKQRGDEAEVEASAERGPTKRGEALTGPSRRSHRQEAAEPVTDPGHSPRAAALFQFLQQPGKNRLNHTVKALGTCLRRVPGIYEVDPVASPGKATCKTVPIPRKKDLFSIGNVGAQSNGFGGLGSGTAPNDRLQIASWRSASRGSGKRKSAYSETKGKDPNPQPRSSTTEPRTVV